MGCLMWQAILAMLSAAMVAGTGEWSEDAEDLGKLLNIYSLYTRLHGKIDR